MSSFSVFVECHCDCASSSPSHYFRSQYAPKSKRIEKFVERELKWILCINWIILDNLDFLWTFFLLSLSFRIKKIKKNHTQRHRRLLSQWTEMCTALMNRGICYWSPMEKYLRIDADRGREGEKRGSFCFAPNKTKRAFRLWQATIGSCAISSTSSQQPWRWYKTNYKLHSIWM